jgi:hydrogenase expression/formation protein HypC
MCLAIPGKVLAIEENDLRIARVEFGGIVKEASLACVPEARPGDYVLVHAGFAISRVDEEQAQRVFAYLKEIGDLEESSGEKP